MIFLYSKLARSLITVAIVCLGITAATSRAASLDCATNKCGLLSDGEYHNLVIGRLVHVGTAGEMARVYHWAKAHGYWKSLPDAPIPYQHNLKLIRIALPHAIAKHPITVFIEATEFDAGPLAIGSLVRYSPHGTKHEAPPKSGPAGLALFHGLSGCVASLCRPSNTACFKRYRQGVFTKQAGKPVDPNTGAVLQGGARINPVSLLPTH